MKVEGNRKEWWVESGRFISIYKLKTNIMASYRLNLNQQPNGDYEVHKDGCDYYPTQNYDSLGSFSSCEPAVGWGEKEISFIKSD